VDLRKYGFTIITGLLTAEFLLKVSEKALLEKVPITVTSIILISALFIIDIYYDSLLRSAVRRAVYLEKQLPVNISFRISASAEKAETNTAGFLVYLVFIIAGTFPLWYPIKTDDIGKFIINVLLIIIPIITSIIIICMLYNYIDIKFEMQCERNAKALVHEYKGQLREAEKLYKKNVEENYSGDFSYLRLAEIYRLDNRINEEINLLKTASSNIEENLSFSRLDKGSKINLFNLRKDEALYIKHCMNNGKNIKNIENDIELLKHNHDSEIQRLNYRFLSIRKEKKKFKRNLEIRNNAKNYFEEKLTELKTMQLLLNKKDVFENDINYIEKQIENLNNQKIKSKKDLITLRKLQNKLEIIKRIKNLLIDYDKKI
jgi:hypothetical protein